MRAEKSGYRKLTRWSPNCQFTLLTTSQNVSVSPTYLIIGPSRGKTKPLDPCPQLLFILFHGAVLLGCGKPSCEGRRLIGWPPLCPCLVLFSILLAPPSHSVPPPRLFETSKPNRSLVQICNQTSSNPCYRVSPIGKALYLPLPQRYPVKWNISLTK